MQVSKFKKDLNALLQSEQYRKSTVGFVPTMGALHSGHISLVRQAFNENEVVVVSIFVNPTQFDNQDDLNKYPSSLENDLQLLESVSKDIIVFTPTKDDIYDGKVKSESYNFNGLEKVMEGEFRAGHFDGVATIVELLLASVNPDKAYFGEKDFQQLQIIKKLVELKKLPYEIIGCPIEREPTGLARSSRNERLSESTRDKSGFIFETLKTAKEKFGTESAKVIKDWVANEFSMNSLFKLEYFEIADIDTLTPILKKQKNRKYRAFIAVYVEEVRLIDNIAIN
ncbi:pantoate--beta-alanine ligase [Croceitalea rosinachiae]|uniref:Pantothenate synthetase n=1 Tax=Croceitalea rosinachiae TaxID=3075596 RepID=A0ABU3A9J5_9FLAO|nr:pantoate--beta-alanine ligase [Croceitalea sp. F388]MDT0606558.1 pantoate--beta-alanine ligase [Croceitalea sp. F388]